VWSADGGMLCVPLCRGICYVTERVSVPLLLSTFPDFRSMWPEGDLETRLCYAVLIDEMTSVCAIHFLESILGLAAEGGFALSLESPFFVFRLTHYYVYLWLCHFSRLFLKTSFRCWCSFGCLPSIVLCLPSVFSNLELAQAVRSLQGNSF
jgi:hypothetical protein